MTPRNPKLEGSNLIDCIPQTGQCPNQCDQCYYNAHGFYTDKKTPVIPRLAEAKNKLVRVNSGHDSNIQKELVLKKTKKFKHKFFNTSIPFFDFPGPVVYTCNSRYTDSSFLGVFDCDNIMMVRFRTNVWNTSLAYEACEYYAKREIPFTLTFMRYASINAIPKHCRGYYTEHKHILNSYWVLKTKACAEILNKAVENSARFISPFYSDTIKGVDIPLVDICGTLTSSYCRDCNRCLNLYHTWCGKNNINTEDLL